MPAIQRMLDHDSPEMTLRYARIKDQTLRREWEEWEAYQQRINIQGGPLSDAAWALENLACAKHRLVEINKPVRVNLIRIIEGVDALPALPEPEQPDA